MASFAISHGRAVGAVPPRIVHKTPDRAARCSAGVNGKQEEGGCGAAHCRRGGRASIPGSLFLLAALAMAAACEQSVHLPATPVAVASGDLVVSLEGDGAPLDAAGSFVPGEDQAALEYEWVVVVAPAGAEGEEQYSLLDAGEPRALFIPKATGLFVVRLLVRHGGRASMPAFVNVRAHDDPVEISPPVADAGADLRVNELELVTLDGEGSHHPDGLSLSHEWTQVDGPYVELSGLDTLTPSFIAPRVLEVEVLTFELAVRTAAGDGATDTVSVQVDQLATHLEFGVHPPSSVEAGRHFGLEVRVTDSDGRIVPVDDVIELRLFAGPQGASLEGDIVVAADEGVAIFNRLSSTSAGADYVIEATSGWLAPALSEPFDVVPAEPRSLVYVEQPPPVVEAGAPFSVSVAAADVFGNLSHAASEVEVQLVEATVGAPIHGPSTVALEEGVGHFDGLEIPLAGMGYALQAAASGLAPALSESFDVSPGAPFALAVRHQPTQPVPAGEPFMVEAWVVDEQGNLVDSYSGTVTARLAAGPGEASLGGPLVASAEHGVARLTGLWVDRVGEGYIVEVSADELLPAASSPFSARAALGREIAFLVQPSSVVAGEVFSPAVVVQVMDVFGNPAVEWEGTVELLLDENPGGATLQGHQATIVDGRAVFEAGWLDKSGEGYVLRAVASDLAPATSAPFDVGHAARHGLAVHQQPPSSIEAGVEFAVVAEVVDAFGNRVPESGTFVDVAMMPVPPGSDAVLLGAPQAVTEAGRASLSGLWIERAGEDYGLELSSDGLLPVETVKLRVEASAPHSLAEKEGPPAEPIEAGAHFAVTVEILDRFGNRVESDGLSVSVDLDAAGHDDATLGGPVSASTIGGAAVFEGLWVTRAGTGYKLVFTSEGLPPRPSSPFDVRHAAAAALEMTEQPADVVTAGEAFGLQARIVDAFGNLVIETGRSVTVAIGAAPPGPAPTLGGTLAATVAGGYVDFDDLWLNRAGEGFRLRVEASDIQQTMSRRFAVEPGPPASLRVVGGPSQPVAAGSHFSVAVDVLDDFQNRTTVDDVPITAALQSSTGATLGGTLEVSTVEGLAELADLWVDKAGTGYRVIVSSDGLGQAQTPRFDVIHGDASGLEISFQPPPQVVAGSHFSFQARVVDAFGNLVLEDGREIEVAVDTDPDEEPVDLFGPSSVHTSSGLAGFSGLSIRRAAAGYRLVVSSSGVSSVRTGEFSVIGASPHSLGVHTQPPGIVRAGRPFEAQIELLDVYGNRSVTDSVSVAVQLLNHADYPGVLSGTRARPSIDGVVTFDDLWLDKVATGYRLEATSVDLESTVTAPFEVKHGTASRLVILRHPPGEVWTNEAFMVRARVEDQFENIALEYASPVTMGFAANAGGGTLTGGGPRVPASGVVSFESLRVTSAGDGYRLRASSTGLTGADTAAFDVKHCHLGVTMSVSKTRALPWDTIALTANGDSCRPEALQYAWTVAQASGATGGFGPWDEFSTLAAGPGADLYVSAVGNYSISVTVTDGFESASAYRSVNVSGFGGLPHHDTGARDSRSLALDAGSGQVFIATRGSSGQLYRYIDILMGPSGWHIIPLSHCLRNDTSWVGIAGDGRVYYGFGDRGDARRVRNIRREWGEWRCTADTYDFASGLASPSRSTDVAFVGNSFYFSTNRGAYYFDRGQQRFTASWSFTNLGSPNNLVAAARDRSGALWFGSGAPAPNDGVVRTGSPPSSGSPAYDYLEGSDKVTALTTGISAGGVNEMFISTDGHGIIRIPSVGQPHFFEQYFLGTGLPPPLDGHARRGNLEPGTGDVWIATRLGIARFKRDVGAFASIPSGFAGLPNGELWDVLFDVGHGRGRRVYVATTNGVFRAVE